jgi:hypothetical protein
VVAECRSAFPVIRVAAALSTHKTLPASPRAQMRALRIDLIVSARARVKDAAPAELISDLGLLPPIGLGGALALPPRRAENNDPAVPSCQLRTG